MSMDTDLMPPIQFFYFTEEQYTYRYGRLPEHDDLDRINCQQVGTVGHGQCGWCDSCNGPRMYCHNCRGTVSQLLKPGEL